MDGNVLIVTECDETPCRTFQGIYATRLPVPFTQAALQRWRRVHHIFEM